MVASGKLRSIMNGRVGIALALGLGRSLPPSIGYPLANWIARRIATNRRLDMVQAARINQWVVNGCALSTAQLDQATLNCFRFTAHFLYDLYHYLDDLPGANQRIRYAPEVESLLEDMRNRKEGRVIVSLHLGNWDLVAQAAAREGLTALVLSFPNPHEGYRWQNQMRISAGLEILPTSRQALRCAAERLQMGGAVMTAIDRPAQGSRYRPRFFGRPTALPVHHIALALKAHVPVQVVCAIMQPDGVYLIQASEPVPMQPDPNRRAEILQNAEAILKVAEGFIRQAPQQWSMFYPVWPEAKAEIR